MAFTAEPHDGVSFSLNPGSKRNMGSVPGTPTKRRRISASSPQSWSSFPSSNQLPEPSSLNDILRKHNRERLFVRPLHWKPQQLQLLRCQFAAKEARRKPKLPDVESCASRKQPQQQATALSSEAITCAVTGISHALSEGYRNCVVDDLLHAHDIHRSRQVASVSCDGSC